MTEREYVETILAIAEAYISWVGQDDLSVPRTWLERQPVVDVAEVQRVLDKAAEKVGNEGPQDGRLRRQK